jgi:putative CocE/NonD family hydrolase
MMSHPNRDEFWKQRNARIGLYNVKPAILVVGGLFDAEDCFGAWNVYKAIEKQSASTDNKIVMGPWSHGQWGSTYDSSLGNVNFGTNTGAWYQQHVEVPFFNYYLKGKGNVDSIKDANIFFSGENSWKKFDRWPPAGVKNKELFFQAKGKLDWKKSAEGKTSYVSDPAKTGSLY